MKLEDIASRFRSAKLQPNGSYLALCPAHDDSTASLSISQGDKGIVLRCFAGCDTKDVLAAVGLGMKDLFNDTPTSVIESRGCSFRDYANAKRLPEEILSSFHVKEKIYKGLPQIEIPYLSESGTTTATRYRISLNGKQKFIWNKGATLSLYGLWRLNEYKDKDIVLVEGESDSHTLWYHNIPTLGLPGASNWREDRDATILNSFDIIYVVLESDREGKPDAGAKAMLKWLGGSVIAPKVQLVTLPCKDVSELHIEDSDAFKTRFEDCLKEAVAFHDYNQNDIEMEDQGYWESPVSLKETTAPELKPDLLPGILGEITRAISTATETPLELAVGLILPVLGTACHGKFIVQVKSGYKEPVNIWVIVALDPANRKSSVLIKMTKPLNEWEGRKRKEFEPVIREAKSVWQNQQARLKSLRGKYGKAKPDELKGIEAEILEIENDLVEVPSHPQVWSQDVTTERCGSLMAEHDGVMSILSAEGGIFDIIGGRYSNGIPNLDLYLQSHSGDPVKVDRGSRDPVYLERPALSLGLSPQPEVLRGLVDKPGFRGRGLLARFLYLLPKTNLGYRRLESEPVPEDVENEYCNLVYSLLDIEQAEDEQGEKIPYILKLSKEAYAEWLEFARVVEKSLREGGRFEYITDWAGKLPGAAARIAGLLHCAENPYQPWAEKISLETMQRSLDLASIFSGHALIAFDMMGADKALEQARKVWRWIERGRQSAFSKRDCFNALKGTFHKVVNMDEALKVLQERNYIQVIQQKTGGRPSINCNVNPMLSKEW